MKKITKASYRKIAFFVAGIGSLVWFLIRVIPKPSRAAYPCMRAAAPIASGFVLYLLGLVSTAALFRSSKRFYSQSRHLLATIFLFAALFAALATTMTADKPVYAKTLAFNQPANTPSGTAKGVNPGRVVWVYNPDATNKNCGNTLGDAYWLTINNDQAVIDQMVSSAIQTLTGETADASAWNAIFQYYNQNHGKGSVSYSAGEKIMIKVNAVSGWSWNSTTREATNYMTETAPQVVLSVLRQLVNVVGVAQSDIYVGDPMKHIYEHCYVLWNAEFPDVHYLDNTLSSYGREVAVKSTTDKIYYSDRGAVIPAMNDNLYKIFKDAEYMINIPALKAHARAGVSMFAKNHLGSQTRSDAMHMHNGLVDPNQTGTIRQGTPLYRLQVDLMAHKLLGGKTLFYLLDGLWAGPEAVERPTKWTSTPFNTDWTSSIFASLDPVAIESVGFDFLRTEYYNKNGSYPQMDGVDDYLHQTADPALRPPGITYDPDHSTTTDPLVTSLGVHEHWNNATNKQYTRNLGTGNGVELIHPVRWLGTTSSNWNTGSNWWGGIVPLSITNIIIPSTPNQPAVEITTAECNALTLNPGSSLTINAGEALTVNRNLNNNGGTLTINSTGVNSNGSLIVKGTSSGNVTYNRYMPNDAVWHYVSSPVSLSSPATGSFYGWNEETGQWDASPINTTTNPLVSGRGYTLVGGGSVSFTGPIVTTPFTVQGTAPYDSPGTYANNRGTWGGGGWNLLGNPFTSAMSATTFISVNGTSGNGSLDPNYQAVYIYNGSDYYYIASAVPGYYGLGAFPTYTDIQAGQGFFVLANYDGVLFSFTPGMQTPDITVPMTKSARAENPWPGLQLKVKYGDKENSTMVVYNEKMTAGLDPGYDVGLYSAGSDVEIYTSLVENNNNVNFARQALPIANADTIIVPVGIDSEKGGKVTFSAYTVPLGNNKFWLEDRKTGVFTDLSLTTYTATLSSNTHGTGRFYLKAATTITGIKPVLVNPGELGVKIWVSKNMLNIEGEISAQATCTVYDMFGHKVLETKLTDARLNTISVPIVVNGIYLVRITDGNKTVTKKVFL